MNKIQKSCVREIVDKPMSRTEAEDQCVKLLGLKPNEAIWLITVALNEGTIRHIDDSSLIGPNVTITTPPNLRKES